MANQPTGLFGYKGSFVLTPHGPTMDIVRIKCGGAVYRSVTGEVSAPAGAGLNIRYFDDNGNPLQGGDGACPSSLVLGENSNENETLRAFRDTVLRTTPAGAALVTNYYHFAPELVSILIKNPLLRQQVKELLFELQPSLRSAIQDGRLNIALGTQKKIGAMCTALAQKASPELSAFIKQAQHVFITGRLFQELKIPSSES